MSKPMRFAGQLKVNMLVFFLAILFGSSVADQFIIGGSNAALGNWPWMGALLAPTGSLTCGCVLVHDNWVLTAAHCVTGSEYLFEFGMIIIGQGLRFSATAWVQHPNFGQGAGALPNDIAVMHHSGGIRGSNIAPITDFDTTSDDPTQDNCYITGWGSMCAGCPLVTTLQEVNIPVIDDVTCSSRWGSYYNSAVHICAWNQMHTGGICYGESGGPLVCDDGAGWRLCGTVSLNVAPCGGSPSVFARISSYGSWVCGETSGDVCW